VNQNYFNWVEAETPCVINLYWKEKEDSPEQFVGSYSLNLKALLDAGYLKSDANHHNQVFLRFQRSADNKIQIAINKSSKSIDCGIVIRT
jgi:hypothetical protein